MKRKRSETKEDRICELGSQWISSKRAPEEDEAGLSEVAYEYMNSRPSLKQYGYYSVGKNGHYPCANGRHVSQTDPVRHSRRRFFHENEEEWISELGSQYMKRKRLHEIYGSASDSGAYFSERNYLKERDNELDDSWIADFGCRWMRKRRRMQDHDSMIESGEQHNKRRKVGDDASICEMGYQWMSRSKEREAMNGMWLSEISSQYMNQRNLHDDDWINELGSDYMNRRRSFLEEGCVEEWGSQWEARRKVNFEEPEYDAEAEDFENVEELEGQGEFERGRNFLESEYGVESKVEGSDGFQVLESNPEDQAPNVNVNLVSSSSSS